MAPVSRQVGAAVVNTHGVLAETNNLNQFSDSSMSEEVKKTTVAIIGGGIAGLSCATELIQASAKTNHQFIPTVFDTGRLRPGGRCSSRFPGDTSDDAREYPILFKHLVDHAAQMITIPKHFPAFEDQVLQWEKDGLIRRFPSGTVCEITRNRNPKSKRSFYVRSLNRDLNEGDVSPGSRNPISQPYFYAVNGMGSIPLSIANSSGLDVRQDVWVSPSGGVSLRSPDKHSPDPYWSVKAKGKELGRFDQLVIAHNGKCADRLMSRTPAKDLHSLLRVNFSSSVPKDGGRRMTLNSLYSLTFAIAAESSPLSRVLYEDRFICGYIRNQPDLRFLSCQTRKYPDNNQVDNGSEQNGSKQKVEVWTILSSAQFAKRYKAPQENLPADVVQNVTRLLLEALEDSLDLQDGSLSGSGEEHDANSLVLESRLQLWGAAVPLNAWVTSDENNSDENGGMGKGFLFDGESAVGTCGDWLLEPSIGGAWESGRRLAQFMVNSPKEQDRDGTPTSIGLTGKFVASQQATKSGIGSL